MTTQTFVVKVTHPNKDITWNEDDFKYELHENHRFSHFIVKEINFTECIRCKGKGFFLVGSDECKCLDCNGTGKANLFCTLK